jgi:hypothetical protein
MNEGWGRWQSAAIAAAALVVGALLWRLGDKTTFTAGLILISMVSAAAVAWLAPSRPAMAFGILFLVATLSRWAISTSIGNMRLEQPVILAGYAAILLAPSRFDLRRIKSLWPIGAAFGAYLVCLGLSSVLFSPDKGDSYRMTIWTALSMSGGLLAFIFLYRASAQAPQWLRFSGYVQALAAFVFAILYFTLGPVLVSGPFPAPGVQDAVSSLPKVFALSWEANLYASLVAALAIFGLDRLLSRGRAVDKALVLVLVAAIALGVTRGAYLGLGAGVIAYAFVAMGPKLTRLQLDIRRVGIPVTAFAGSFLLGILVAGVLMAGGRQPTKPLDLTKPDLGRAPVAIATGQPGQHGQPGKPGTQPETPPTVTILPPADTVSFRMDRVMPALRDVPNSLLIGLGANSFGQRHTDPSTMGQPDHIATLALAALYESGVIGASGLAIGFGLILLRFLKAAWSRSDKGTMAAYAGSVVCLLVAYEATNAINFALIWLIAGAGLAAASAQPVASADPAPLEQPAS